MKGDFEVNGGNSLATTLEREEGFQRIFNVMAASDPDLRLVRDRARLDLEHFLGHDQMLLEEDDDEEQDQDKY